MSNRLSAYAALGTVLTAVVFCGCGCGNERSAPSLDSPSGSPSTSMPDPTGAKALSNHYVEVSFREAVGSAAENPENYVITGPDSTALAVTDA